MTSVEGGKRLDEQEAKWALWMVAASAGDRDAYHRLLVALAPLVTAIVRHCLMRHAQDDTDLEDVVQDCFLTLHLKRHLWDPTRPLVPWVRALVTNKCLDALRRKGATKTLQIEDFENVISAPETQPASTPSQSELQALVLRLKGRSRDVLTAVALQGMSIKTAATKLGLSEGNARVALHRGIKVLAEISRRSRT
jgi:RNA polymerase sigma-70 factor (ECF subfamily)